MLRERFNLLAMVPDSRPSMRFPWTLLERIFPVNAGRAAQFLDFGRSLLKPVPKVLKALEGCYNPEDYDLVVGRYLRSIAAVGVPSSVPVCLDIDDLDTDRLEAKLNSASNSRWHRSIYRSQIRAMRKRLPAFLERFDHVWVCNPKDKNVFNLSSSTILPNIPIQEPDEEGLKALDFPAKSYEVGVIASFRYDVNEQGLDWFLGQVWPVVIEGVPEAQFRIYGSGISDAMRDRWSRQSSVSVVGFVDSVEDAYRSSAVMVCPVLSGGGTNIKVVEAAFLGRVCVLTETATRGFREYSQLAGSLVYGKDAAQMASEIVNLLRKPERCQEVAVRHNSQFRELYSWDSFSATVREGIVSVIGEWSEEDG